MKNRNALANVLPYIIVMIAIYSIFSMTNTALVNKLSYNDFNKIVEEEKIVSAEVIVSNVVLDIEGVYLDENNQEMAFTTVVPNTEKVNNELIENLVAKNAQIVVVNAYETNVFWDVIMQVVPYILMGGFVLYLLTKMNGAGGNNNAFEFGKSKARLESDIKVRFTDVEGCEEEKAEMEELIDYLKNPKRFSKMGARIPKGILLVGPPGTGKTLLAKAVAGEADVPFFSISGSDFVEMFVGVGASRVRDMFKNAGKTAPAMIFIDEIDAVGRQRGAGVGGGHDEREQTLNQLLVEMDGINDNAGILIIAATNRPDILDPALLRPGRFDRQITVSLPDRKGREAILGVHARNKHIADDVDLGALAKRTPGFSGADLENVLNEAAILAVRNNQDVITMDLMDEAIDRVMMGPAKRSRTYTEKEKRLVAYHETGHAVIGLKLNEAQLVQKVTIIPRGVAGGYNLMTPKEETLLNTKGSLLAIITGYLGGRVAEEIVFNEISTGASNDIERSTKLAREMVTVYGMSELGPIKYDSGEHSVFLGRDYGARANVSGGVAFEIDQAVRQIIDDCYKRAQEIITENRQLLDTIAEALLEHETLTSEQIYALAEGKTVQEVFAAS
ncbi:MAG: ATP-dependent zinc metalloprotease FtsH [Erysipelotrichaceae bacterium]|nr:ATP-dependent zinc metalloprotease FtsH [Erysipelotrichaceae bacterium]MDD3924474.1 ATP-dependent zinc metalloprotease FtsH [Erysipelotrichaceae bacterium]MDD4642641.1 ATP-dependent zinc metalloprotease FtsH [Erysipelotrichaceae bacterium]